MKKFNVFNTNNLWISLPAVQRVIEEGTLDMEVIVNPKTLDGGINVIQLEVKLLQHYSTVTPSNRRTVALCNFIGHH